MAIDLLTGKEWNPDANMLPMADKNGKRYAMLYEPGHQHHGWIFYDNHGTWVTYRVGLMHEVLRAGRIIEDKKRHEPPQAAPAVGAQVDRRVRPRTCATCAHRSGIMIFARCMLSGYYIETERKYPTICGVDFRGWQQREHLLRRMQAWLYAA